MKLNLFASEYKSLTNAEQKIIDYINENPNEFAENSIEKNAVETFASTAVLSRIYKKLGFSSYKDMQFYVKYNYLSNLKIPKELLDNSIYKIAKTYMEAINLTSKYLDIKEIDYICEEINKSKLVYCFGIGSSSISAKELSLNIEKFDYYSVFHNDFHNFLISLYSHELKENKPPVILFSKSGKTNEILFLCETLLEHKFPFLLITANRLLKNKYPHVLLHETIEQKERYHALSSKIVQQYIADIIADHLISNNPNKLNRKNWLKMINEWNNLKKHD
ncbi:MurR/RpiR family transcriptional regulator [Mycoplasmopsis fermentans]|uniref:MurR/RpiR family transcriptional regulator n=1 Tax=Mycoplasmopsis fermentans TaxID=2115 RepID=UPI000F01FDFB|nr:MurR/RpiR family transcriptional regulator [Mycoplasmopsis fermentans]RMX35574.1 helix-turn-helix domain, rpiR family protein [Mycoplasmopsis fermentans MF-I2]